MFMLTTILSGTLIRRVCVLRLMNERFRKKLPGKRMKSVRDGGLGKLGKNVKKLRRMLKEIGEHSQEIIRYIRSSI